VIPRCRWIWGALLVSQFVLALPQARAQGFFYDNEARKFIQKVQADLLSAELALKERISAVDAASKAAIASTQQESQARSEAVARQAAQRVEASESRVREALEALAATLNRRIDGTNASLRDELNRQGAALLAQQGVLGENQAVLQGDMKAQALQQDEFNRAAAARLQDLTKDTGALKGSQTVLEGDFRDQVRKQDDFNVSAAARLRDLDNSIAALKAGRIEVSRAIDQLREDVQKWLAPLQSSADQLTRDLTAVQRTLRDHATLIADNRRRADEESRKLDERIKEFVEALSEGKVQWQKALAEQDASQAQRLAGAVREFEQKSRQAEERSARLEQALRVAQERADKVDTLIARADERLALADQRLAEAARRLADAERRLGEVDRTLADLDQRLGEGDKRSADAEGRISEAEKQLLRADARLGEFDSSRSQAEDRAREADARLGRLDEALRRADERQTQADARSAKLDERAQRMETRWRLVDDQARQRAAEPDLSPLGQRVDKLDDRLRKLEPVPVVLDGREFLAPPEEKRLYDEAIGSLAKSDFPRAADQFNQFVRRFPSSPYLGWALFWHGQALLGQREFRRAVSSFARMTDEMSEHPKAPDAMLGLAAGQLELKDKAAARRTLDALLRLYPSSEASRIARQRLLSIK